MIESQAVTISEGTSRATATGARLKDWANRQGSPAQGPVGSAGAVALIASSAGATIFAGDLLSHVPTALQFQVTATGLYQNGQQVPIGALAQGPATNLPAGTVLQWVSPRSGVVGGTATVVAQADGSGLSGGANAETDDVLRARLDYLAFNPPASGNDGQYQDTASKTPNVAVQQCFTYPAVLGPGTTGVAFTLRPATPGANRIPTSTQIALVAAYLGGVMPASDGILMCTIVAAPVVVALKVLWAVGSTGWADSTTFPLYHQMVSNPGDRLVSASANAGGTLSPLAFRLSSAAMLEIPQVGQSIGFFDLSNGVFRKKKILTVTTISGTAYDITVDTTNGVSDTGYAPLSGQACCPWSDGLTSMVPSIVSYFDTVGPGEQFVSFFDPGLRQRRSPLSPQYWPNQVTNRLLGGASAPVPAQGSQQNQPPVPTLLTLTTLQDVVLLEPAVPFGPPVGSPGVLSNMLTLGNIAVFPE